MKIRVVAVASPAPRMPIGGRPRCPKISAQFATMFTRFATIAITIAGRTIPRPARYCLSAV